MGSLGRPCHSTAMRRALLLALAALVPACGGGGSSGGFPPAPPQIPPPGPGFGAYGVAYGFISTGAATGLALDATHQISAGPIFFPPAWRIEKRSRADGTLDPGFGSGGQVVEPILGGWLHAMAATATDLFIGGSENFPLSSSTTGRWRLERRSRASGALVGGFGAAGVVAQDHSAGADEIQALAVDATALYVVGYDSVPGAGQGRWRIEKRLQSDGSLVAGFGAGGVLSTDPSPAFDRPHGVATDGTHLWIAGLDEGPGGGDYRWRIEKRSTTDGALVAGFGVGGVVVENPTASSDQARAVLLHGGALFIAGHNGNAGADWRIEKRDPVSGALIAAFGNGGVIHVPASVGQDVAGSLAAEGANLFVGGYDNAQGVGVFQWRVEKRDTASGALVTSFGQGGVVQNGLKGAWGGVCALAATPAELYIAGIDQNPSGQVRADWRLERRSALTGIREGGYGLDGTRLVNEALSSEYRGLAVDGDWLYTAAREEIGAGNDFRWRIQKLRRVDAEPDPAFGILGDLVVNPSGGFDVPYAAGVAGGGLFVVGAIQDRGAPNLDWRVDKRSLVDGGPYPGFGTEGAVVSRLPGMGGVAAAVAFDATHAYVVGHQDNPDSEWRIEKRRLDSGALDLGFGTGGAILIDPSVEHDSASAVAVAGGFLYVAGLDSVLAAGNFRWRVEKRSTLNGALIPGFGSGGVLAFDVAPGAEEMLPSLAVDATSIYLGGCGRDAGSGYRQWRIEKRSAATGAPDGGFTTVTLPSPDGDTVVHALAIEGALLYAVGYEHLPGSGLIRWRIERRQTSNGALDGSFGAGGVTTSGDPHGLFGAIPYAIALDATYVYVGGTDPSGSHKESRLDRRAK